MGRLRRTGVLYNGYEQQSKEFLDGTGLDWYDYKNRFYDNQIGRFFGQDRLADEYVYYTPYQFAGNEVPNAIDLDGLEPIIGHLLSEKLRNAGNAFLNWLSSSDKPRREITPEQRESINRFNQASKEAIDFLAMAQAGYEITMTPSGGRSSSSSAMAAEENTMAIGAARAEAAVAKQEVSLAARAKEIHSALPIGTQNRNTTAVASATSPQGDAVTLVASNEKYLRKAQRAVLQPGEIAVTGKGHAEQTIINHANANGITVNAVAASRPICAGCATAINEAGATPASPLKIIKPSVAASTYVKPPPKSLE